MILQKLMEVGRETDCVARSGGNEPMFQVSGPEKRRRLRSRERQAALRFHLRNENHRVGLGETTCQGRRGLRKCGRTRPQNSFPCTPTNKETFYHHAIGESKFPQESEWASSPDRRLRCPSPVTLRTFLCATIGACRWNYSFAS